MTAYLCISARFVGASGRASYHGRSDGGVPEWPPSPLRLFQALVAASAARFGNPEQFRDYAIPAFDWLAGLHPPAVIAPVGVAGVPFRIAVPNNDMDVVARAWAGRVEPPKQPAELKTLKTVWPTYLDLAGDLPAVHFLWEIADADQAGCELHKELLFAAARNLVALGWGTDMVVGDGRVLSPDEIGILNGERWEPASAAGAAELRVPTPGTFDALLARRSAFLSRLGKDGFVPVPPLTEFATVGYRRSTDVPGRPFLAFELRTPDFERFQPYTPARRACAVAGMVRNALAGLAGQMRPFGWTDDDINTFVHGHTPDGEGPARGPGADRRFAYLPLPSLEHRGDAGVVVTKIRRVLVVGPPGGSREVEWARVLSGRDLAPLGGTPPAALRLVDRPAAALDSDPNLGPYVGRGAVWSTVTPVVLPGFDDGDPGKAERLLRKAFEQAGIPSELVRGASLEWRHSGYRAGVDLATRYLRPEPCRLPRCHVRVCWPAPIRGPLAVGAVRYRGLGVFALE